MIRAVAGVDCCDYPIAMDTYKGCSHNCKYCFVRGFHGIENVEPIRQVKSLENFINGQRNRLTRAFAWDIPVKIGTMCDPFQPCEKEHGETLKCLELLAKTGYPCIINTKNPAMLVDEPYKTVISKCNCLLNVTMACPRYDKLESGAPTYEDRLNAVKKIAPFVKRVNALCMPLFVDAAKDIRAEITKWADAGVYGAIFSGFVTNKKTKGMIKDGKDYMFALDRIVPIYKSLREKCHKNGLRFFCGDARVRFLGDSLTCCGTENMAGFKPSTANMPHLAHGGDAEIMPSMREKGSAYVFIGQNHKLSNYYKLQEATYEEKLNENAENYIDYWRNLRQKYGD